MKNLHSGKTPELFMALEIPDANQEILQSLTTEIMQWSDKVWIMDLTRFYSYWQEQAISRETTPLILWRKLFNHLLDGEPKEAAAKVIALSPAYRACCARNPWLALLLLRAMKEREIKGLLSFSSNFGQSLFREISWGTWWHETEVIAAHFQTAKLKGFTQAGFRQQCKRLKLAIPRLDFKRPWEMEILHREGVKKRFGEALANLWEWSYGKVVQEAATIYQTRFPWKAWQFKGPPAIKRLTDYPLLFWEQFVPLLVEDFDNLAQVLVNTGNRITRIDWRLQLEDRSDLEVPILFRNPHDPQAEKGKQTTALLQANYGFCEAVSARFTGLGQSSHLEEVPAVLGWQLTISGSLRLPDIVLDIFGQSQERDGDLEVLLRLENELPVDLHRFSAQGDWFPEDSFLPEYFEANEVKPVESPLRRSLNALATERPLFIRNDPLPLSQSTLVANQHFLESTMVKWWRRESVGAKERHYFKHIDPEGNALWVFQDSVGQWYQHGVFG